MGGHYGTFRVRKEHYDARHNCFAYIVRNGGIVRYGDDGCFARFWECWTAKEALFKLTGKGPLLSLSAFDLPADVALHHVKDHGCAVVTAMRLG